jgi:hypothetical protein
MFFNNYHADSLSYKIVLTSQLIDAVQQVLKDDEITISSGSCSSS